CALDYRADEPDDLGNPGSLGYRCFEEGECSTWRACPSGQLCTNGVCGGEPTADDCVLSQVCDTGEKCDEYGSRTCKPADDWLVATATLYTAFDGLTHEFTAMSEYLSASGCSEANETYWSTTDFGCTSLRSEERRVGKEWRSRWWPDP